MRTTGRRRFSLGLRTRVTIAFSVAGLVISVGLAALTYSLARNYLQGQFDRTSRTQAFFNAAILRDKLRAGDTPLDRIVQGLSLERGGYAFAEQGEQWIPGDRRVDQLLPASLVNAVLGGGTGRQRFRVNGQPFAAVGVNVREFDIRYFEVTPMTDVARTLGVISTSLFIAASVTTLGAASLGWWASRRLLRPLSRVADAASELASGGLDTRLDEENDPDLRRLSQSFNDMADAVQSRIERETRFASDVSHELRSPITALTAAIEVLDGRREELGDRSQQALDVVVNQVRRFDQMVLDLLEISRLDAGRAEVHIEPVMLGPFLSKVAAHYGFDGLPVVIDPRWFERPVPIDRRRLERVVANLLLNAQHHGGGPVRMSVQHVTETSVRLTVDDAGPGVDPTERQRIFERFARGDGARHRVGTGLGLALVAEQTRLHGGRVWVEERPGGGARFIVELDAELY